MNDWSYLKKKKIIGSSNRIFIAKIDGKRTIKLLSIDIKNVKTGSRSVSHFPRSKMAEANRIESNQIERENKKERKEDGKKEGRKNDS